MGICFKYLYLQSRTEAMQILNQNMPADFINSDYWPQIRKNLLDVMTEPEDSLTVGHSLFVTIIYLSPIFDCLTVKWFLTEKSSYKIATTIYIKLIHCSNWLWKLMNLKCFNVTNVFIIYINLKFKKKIIIYII